MTYQYTPEQIERYRKKIHDLSGELQQLRHERKWEKEHIQWLYQSGRQTITEHGKTRAHASYVDYFTVGRLLEQAGKIVADCQARSTVNSPTNHGWVGKLSYWLCGSYWLYLYFQSKVGAIVGAWRFFRWHWSYGYGAKANWLDAYRRGVEWRRIQRTRRRQAKPVL